MRILIFSDLHANLEALLALQQAEQRPDSIFFLGDAVGYGPDPLACTMWLKQNAYAWVQGDHDAAAAVDTDCASPDEWKEAAHATREMNRAMLPPSLLAYLGALPVRQDIELGGTRFHLSHRLTGITDAPIISEGPVQDLFAETMADVILFGHTHIPVLRRVGNRYLANPGSLGQPRHGLPSCTYAVWNDGELKIQHIDYDPRATIQKLGMVPLDPEAVVQLQETLRAGI